jgi:hypothetical protein
VCFRLHTYVFQAVFLPGVLTNILCSSLMYLICVVNANLTIEQTRCILCVDKEVADCI